MSKLAVEEFVKQNQGELLYIAQEAFIKHGYLFCEEFIKEYFNEARAVAAGKGRLYVKEQNDRMALASIWNLIEVEVPASGEK